MNKIVLLLLAILLTSCKKPDSTLRALDAHTQIQRGTFSVETGTGRWGFNPADKADAVSVYVPIEYGNTMSNYIGKTVDARFLRLERSVEGTGGNIVLVDFTEVRK